MTDHLRQDHHHSHDDQAHTADYRTWVKSRRYRLVALRLVDAIGDELWVPFRDATLLPPENWLGLRVTAGERNG